MGRYKEVTITLHIDEQQTAAVEEMLEEYKKYESKEDGSKPFADWTFEKCFEAIMEVGSKWTIWQHIKECQYRMGTIDTDELIDKQNLTLAERRARKAGEVS